MPLPQSFFAHPTPDVARALLGALLARHLPTGELLRGRVVETEAYHGLEDSASHARFGEGGRAAPMFGQPGRAYIYLIYGMYHMLNVTTADVGVPGAVLIRAIEPLAGIEAMRALRPVARRKPHNLTNGPGKLCQAFAIDRALNGTNLTITGALWFERGDPLPEERVACGPRIGIGYADAADQARPWRFWEKGNLWVSK